MQNLKDELQNIITGNGQKSDCSLIKRAQVFLGGNEIPSFKTSKKQPLKSEEEKQLLNFIEQENLFFIEDISEKNFIGEGAEQKVYRFDNQHVIKLNDAIFYEFWKDYFNSLLIHNYFFHATQYKLLGFKKFNNKLFAVVKQTFIEATETVDLQIIKEFLKFNNFKNIRNNDYKTMN